MDGLDDFKRRIEDWKRRAESLGGEVPLGQLLTPDFLQHNTQFSSLDQMIEASGFKVDTKEDFEKLPDAEWNAFVARSTKFPDWQSMLRAAVEEYAAAKLKF